MASKRLRKQMTSWDEAGPPIAGMTYALTDDGVAITLPMPSIDYTLRLHFPACNFDPFAQADRRWARLVSERFRLVCPELCRWKRPPMEGISFKYYGFPATPPGVWPEHLVQLVHARLVCSPTLAEAVDAIISRATDADHAAAQTGTIVLLLCTAGEAPPVPPARMGPHFFVMIDPCWMELDRIRGDGPAPTASMADGRLVPCCSRPYSGERLLTEVVMPWATEARAEASTNAHAATEAMVDGPAPVGGAASVFMEAEVAAAPLPVPAAPVQHHYVPIAAPYLDEEPTCKEAIARLLAELHARGWTRLILDTGSRGNMPVQLTLPAGVIAEHAWLQSRTACSPDALRQQTQERNERYGLESGPHAPSWAEHPNAPPWLRRVKGHCYDW